MDDDDDATSARLLGFEGWDRVERLPGGRGGAGVAWKDGRAHVVKRYSTDGAGGARERAALSALDGATGTPRLLAEADDPPSLVMTFIPGEGSLADALLGSDPGVASHALLRWAEALGALHAAGTDDLREAFVLALAERAPGLAPRTLAGDFEAAAQRYGSVLEQLGLPPHSQALDDLRALPAALGDVRREVLSPADTCPDNNVLGADRVHLIDFEHAELRHPAWDVAYLLAPWPSCWCAWLLPDEVAAAAVARYRESAAPFAADPDFLAHLDLATLGWQAMTPAWFLEGALGSDDHETASRRPSRRAFVLHRLAAVAGNTTRPALAALAADLHAACRERWGDVVLELAPAFRAGWHS